MLGRYISFIRGASVNRIGLVGVILTTSSFITFAILELARLLGILTNAYLDLVTYLLSPALFVIGLILIPIGWSYQKRQTGKTTQELLKDQFGEQQAQGGLWGSKLLSSVGMLTLINILFLGTASTRMPGFMDEPVFCGTACHSSRQMEERLITRLTHKVTKWCLSLDTIRTPSGALRRVLHLQIQSLRSAGSQYNRCVHNCLT